MDLRRTRAEEPELNVIPLIDIVFILLIFFIVTTTFTRETQIKLNLPVANSDQLKTEDKIVEVSVDAQGQYFVNGQAVINTDVETLKRALQKSAGDLKDPPLIISADGKTPHQAVITVMDAARQLGFVHMTFTTQQSKDAP